MKTQLAFIISVVCLFISTGCTNRSSLSVTSSSNNYKAVLNTEYYIDDGDIEKIKLQNGAFDKATVSGSASKTNATLGNNLLFSDINNDNAEDAVVTLEINYGGSGTFTYLALLLNQFNILNNVDTVFLGDRVIVDSIDIYHDLITVTVLKRHDNESMITPPSVKNIRKFKLLGSQLIELH